MTLERIIKRARKLGKIRDGFVICDNCDTPADRASLKLSWVGCGPCIFGSSKDLDPEEFIHVPERRGE